ncbi:hypothetical protein LJC18_00985 [Lachnospiraceae bacterium OttesenSCG-928-E19]|nr:hypothetical protein [Lachnospiraceae bacterium OttesenSCG-928-E19]
MKLYDVFVDCAICGIEAPGHITLDQYFEKYKKLGHSEISPHKTQGFLNALYSFNFPGIVPGLNPDTLNIVSQIVIHLHMISDRLKEWMALAIFSGDYSDTEEKVFLYKALRIRDVLTEKLRQNLEYIPAAMTYIHAETTKTKYSSHFKKINDMFENKELISIEKYAPLLMLKTKRLSQFTGPYYQIKNDNYDGDKNGMMNFAEFENMMSMEKLVKLKENPIKYQISRYSENDYSGEDAYGYMKVLDDTVRLHHESAKSALIENLLLAQSQTDYPTDLRDRLTSNFNQMTDVSDIAPLYKHVMRQK